MVWILDNDRYAMSDIRGHIELKSHAEEWNGQKEVQNNN